eukprot:TRINITY_DN4063_c0_g1_i1.p1 TRINITY_DN4063_c0_g1~~TRINITY_DN4063_c0_g1_i1.p1  ORF type:complete len:206 (+),score=25.01 TRINITY_DN4063_c0_g1_i1:76-693(+)
MQHTSLEGLLEDKLKSEILGIYIQGSRLWGCAVKNSDFDLLVIVKSDIPKGSTHMGTQYDVTYSGERVFLDRLRNNCLYEVCAAASPEEFIIKRYVKMPTDLSEILNRKYLRKYLEDETAKIHALGEKFASKNDVRKHAKLYTHAYHLLFLAHQFSTTGSINNFSGDLKTLRGVLTLLPESWEAPNWEKAGTMYKSMEATALSSL